MRCQKIILAPLPFALNHLRRRLFILRRQGILGFLIEVFHCYRDPFSFDAFELELVNETTHKGVVVQ